jgi:predicted nucleotidyltransferase
MRDDAEAVRLIREAVPDVVVIYRFGSSAQGTMHGRSDVDLAFFAPHALDPMRRFTLQEDLAIALGRAVDLVDLTAASTVLRMQVVSQGLVIGVFDAGEQANFETYVYSAYARLNEERKDILDQVRREGTIHGR